MSPARIHNLADYVRRLDVSGEDKLIAIARDVDGLEVLARTNAEAQRATGDAVVAVADTLQDHGERLERIEAGVLESIQIAKAAASSAREAQASDVDLAQTIEREKAARVAEAERMRELLAPIVADASRKAGNAGAVKTAGAFSLAALVAGLAAQPVETIKLLREIGPVGAAVAVVVLLAALVWSRRGRS